MKETVGKISDGTVEVQIWGDDLIITNGIDEVICSVGDSYDLVEIFKNIPAVIEANKIDAAYEEMKEREIHGDT